MASACNNRKHRRIKLSNVTLSVLKINKNLAYNRSSYYVLTRSYSDFSFHLHSNDLHENLKQAMVGHDVLRHRHQVAARVVVGGSVEEGTGDDVARRKWHGGASSDGWRCGRTWRKS